MLGRVGVMIGGLVAALGSALGGALALRGIRRRRRAERKAARQAARAARRASLTGGAGPVAPRAAAAEEVAAAAEGGVTADAPAHGDGDDLQAIRGIGAAIATRLHEAGVSTWAQIAAWSDAEQADIAARIHVRPERIARERWVEQARALTSGGPS
jgi:large subunit ribosomal protein L21